MSPSSKDSHSIASELALAVTELKEAGVDSPRLTAELLLAGILGCDRVRLLTHPEAHLGEASASAYRACVVRRTSGEPLQYIRGEQEFYGLRFLVNPGVLIPRPETEVLVERAAELAGRATGGIRSRFADIGTGSGCIAVSLAHEVPHLRGWGVDVSAAALEVARMNAVRHGTGDRLGFVQSDLLSAFPKSPCFGMIVCNPPYVAAHEADTLSPTVARFEPATALFGGPTGLEVYERLIPEVPARLCTEGFLLLEVGLGQSAAVGSLVEAAGLIVDETREDLQRIPRLLVAHKPSSLI